MRRRLPPHRTSRPRNRCRRAGYTLRALPLLACMLAPGFALAQENLFVYATNQFSNNVSVYRTNADGTLTAVTTFGSVGTGPAGVAIRGDQAFMYVVATGNDSLHVVDTSNNSIVQSITTGLNDPRDLAVSPDGKRLYVPNNGTNTVSVFTIDTATGQLTASGTINVGSGARSVVFTPDGTRAYVANQFAGTVSVINVATSTVTATITPGGQLYDIAINPDGSRVYVSDVSGFNVYAIATATNTVVATVGSMNNPRGVAVNGDGTKYYVTQLNTHSIAVVDATANTVDTTTAIGDAPTDFTLAPAGGFAYVASANNDTVVSVTVAAGTGAITSNGSIAAGDNPNGIIICSRGDTLLASGNTFVANTGAALGCTGSSAEFTGGTLRVNGAAQTFATPISVGTGGGTIDTNGNNATISSVISGSAALTKTGTGTLTLTGTSTHTGTLTVSAGTLAINGTLNSSTITVAAGTTLSGTGTINGNVIVENGATLSGSLVINGTLTDRNPLPIPVTNVTGLMRNVDLRGIVVIEAGGVVDGGYLEGTVTSKGLIQGVIRLGPGTSISGGRLHGSIAGSEASRARIRAHVEAGTLLENVILLRDSVIEDGILVGRNVVFEDPASIPATLDLAPSLNLVTWHAGYPRRIPLLDVPLRHPGGELVSSGSMLDAIAALDALQSMNASVSQNAAGELIVRFADRYSVLLPTQVRLVQDSAYGVRVNEDGSVLFALGWYEVVAQPAPADIDVLTSTLLASDLLLDARIPAEGANLVAVSLSPLVGGYFVTRPGLYAVPAESGDVPGFATVAQPGEPASLALVVRDATSGNLFRQALLPVAADWQALKNHLVTLGGVTSVAMAADGIVSVVYEGQTLRIKPAYRVEQGARAAGPLVLEAAGDIDGDGVPDYRVAYGDGTSQVFYRLPAR